MLNYTCHFSDESVMRYTLKRFIEILVFVINLVIIFVLITFVVEGLISEAWPVIREVMLSFITPLCFSRCSQILLTIMNSSFILPCDKVCILSCLLLCLTKRFLPCPLLFPPSPLLSLPLPSTITFYIPFLSLFSTSFMFSQMPSFPFPHSAHHSVVSLSLPCPSHSLTVMHAALLTTLSRKTSDGCLLTRFLVITL